MVGIYLIRNKITDEVYIGQSKNIDKRLDSHRRNAKNKKYTLYADMRYYGQSSFEFSVIEECATNSLDERELFWIRTYLEKGYSLYNIIGVRQKERAYERRRYKKAFKKY